jgi:hypothetical protein
LILHHLFIPGCAKLGHGKLASVFIFFSFSCSFFFFSWSWFWFVLVFPYSSLPHMFFSLFLFLAVDGKDQVTSASYLFEMGSFGLQKVTIYKHAYHTTAALMVEMGNIG